MFPHRCSGPLTGIEVRPVAILPRPVPYVPCECFAPSVECAVCGFRNEPGHERRHHRGFVPVITPSGADWLCTGHASILIALITEFPVGRRRSPLKLMLSVPLEAVRW